jgi:SAM-dependent methyltransferase
VSSVPAGPLLNVGSGPVVNPDWISLDGSWQVILAGSRLAKLAALVADREVGHWPRGIRYCDVRKGLPFPGGSVAVVYSSHFLEHLYRDEAAAFLREVYRVLKPAGVCRVVVPDLADAVRDYADGVRDGRARNSERLMEALHVRDRGAPGRGPLGWYRRLTEFSTHKWMYDLEGLVSLLAEAAFTSPQSCAFLESAIPIEQLRGVEQASRVLDGAGICVEARK